jgi:hypothetical protein
MPLWKEVQKARYVHFYINNKEPIHCKDCFFQHPEGREIDDANGTTSPSLTSSGESDLSGFTTDEIAQLNAALEDMVNQEVLDSLSPGIQSPSHYSFALLNHVYHSFILTTQTSLYLSNLCDLFANL